jgi:quinol monooxygenase YgiN
MIKLSLNVKTHPGKKKEFLRALLGFRSLQGLIDHLRKEKGCLNYQIIKDKDQIDEFIIESEWNSIEEYEAHLKGKHYSILIGAIHILCISPKVKLTNESKFSRLEEKENR